MIINENELKELIKVAVREVLEERERVKVKINTGISGKDLIVAYGKFSEVPEEKSNKKLTEEEYHEIKNTHLNIGGKYLMVDFKK